jgi:hypothetical protein
MASIPPRGRRRFALAAALITAITLLLLPVTAADGNRTDRADHVAASDAPGHGAADPHGAPRWRDDDDDDGDDDDGRHGKWHGDDDDDEDDDDDRDSATGRAQGGDDNGRGQDDDDEDDDDDRETSVSAPAPRADASANGGQTSQQTAPSASEPAASPPPASDGGNNQSGRGGNARNRRARNRTPARDGASGRRGRAAGGAESRATSREGVATVPPAAPTGTAPSRSQTTDERERKSAEPRDEPPPVVRTFERVVEVIPTPIKVALAVLCFLLLVAACAWFLLARTARFLRRQRETLLGEIGTLQGALLPNVPAELSQLHASVAYRPAEGLAAGGDFYDAFPLDGGRVGIVVGDVAGHGKEALMHTALLRYTMRAYLEADLQPRTALQVAGRSLDRGFDTLATVILAVYDPRRHVLQYASAGHPPPVFVGRADHVPVTKASSPPIGSGLGTGLRQTTVPLPAGSAVCFFTDGLIEARRDGDLIGRLGLVDIIRDLGPGATAAQVLDRVAAKADNVSDDMAACMFRVFDGPPVPNAPRVEEIEVQEGEPLEPTLGRFLEACGIEERKVEETIATAERTVRQFGGAVISASFQQRLANDPPRIDVKPANLETFAWARARRAAV